MLKKKYIRQIHFLCIHCKADFIVRVKVFLFRMQLFLLLGLLALLFMLLFTVGCAEIFNSGKDNNSDEKPKNKPKSKKASPTKTITKRKAPSKVSVKMSAKVQQKVKSKNVHPKTKPLSKPVPAATITKSKVLANNQPLKVKSSKPQVEKKIKLGHKTGDSVLKIGHSSSFGSYARVEPRKTEEFCSEISSSIPDPDEDVQQ